MSCLTLPRHRAMIVGMILFLAACGQAEPEVESIANDARRQQEQILKQAEQIMNEAENGTAAIERALENEGAIIFENRENLFNEAATNEAEPAPAPTEKGGR